jgi:hypothetical protein
MRCNLEVCGDSCYVWRGTVVVAEQTYYTTNISAIDGHNGTLAFSLASSNDPAINFATLYWSSQSAGNNTTNIWDIISTAPVIVSVPVDATAFQIDIFFSGNPGDAFALKVRQRAHCLPTITHVRAVAGWDVCMYRGGGGLG